MPSGRCINSIADKVGFCGENAVASSKNNAGASELVFGDEILDGLKVVRLQMILIGLR